MKNNTILLVLLSMLLFSACRKKGDELNGRYEVLVGTWSWYHTYGSGGTGIEGYHDRTPASTGNSYRIKFEKVGRFKTWKNGELLNKGTVKHFNTATFSLVDGDYEQHSGFYEYHNDMISLSRWPTNEASNITNYFVRVN